MNNKGYPWQCVLGILFFIMPEVSDGLTIVGPWHDALMVVITKWMKILPKYKFKNSFRYAQNMV